MICIVFTFLSIFFHRKSYVTFIARTIFYLQMNLHDMYIEITFLTKRFVASNTFFCNFQDFLKRRLRRRFGRFAPENPKTCNRNPPSSRNLAIEPPHGGSETPLFLVLGRQEELGRGLMHPWLLVF